MMRLFLALLVVLTGVGMAEAGEVKTSAFKAYQLTPGDRLTVTVFGQADLSGDFQIEGTGNIEMPLIGAVPVAELTVTQTEKVISTRLADGFLKKPIVNVRIAALRPIYIIGDVRTPGRYDYRHGSNVLSAVAMAGGYGAAPPAAAGAAADALLADERVRTLHTSLAVASVRKARLQAQLKGDDSFDAPTLQNFKGTRAGIEELVTSEQLILDSEQAALELSLKLLRDQKPLLAETDSALDEQISAEKKQLKIVGDQIARMESLRKRGLLTNPTMITLQRDHATLSSNVSRFRSEKARLSISLGETDIKIHDARNLYNTRLRTELQIVVGKLRELATMLPAAIEVRRVRMQLAGGVIDGPVANQARKIEIQRFKDGALKSIVATEATALRPGDTVRVRFNLPRGVKGSAGLPERGSGRARQSADNGSYPQAGN